MSDEQSAIAVFDSVHSSLITHHSSLKNVVSEFQIIALVEQLEHKVGLLKGVCDDRAKHISQLERDKSDLAERLKEQETLTKELQKKLDNSEKKVLKSKDLSIIVSNNLSGTDTNAELKKQLDEYIREIERCIAHLSSLS